MERPYQVDIKEDRVNKLLGRREVKLIIRHEFRGTPSRRDVKEILSKIFDIPPENIYIRRIETIYGSCISEVHAHLYFDKERGEALEPEYIKERDRRGEEK
ncbi:MAG: 30S ribosomal protein S24e [Thermoprotei archaeon]|nr:MAG: 30S ribosomal protein S24e [Thermoprotei archaeon]